MTEKTHNQLADFLVAEMSAGLVVLDEQRRVCRVNPAFCAMFGLDDAEVIGAKLSSIDGLGDFAEYLLAHQDERSLFTFTRADGSIRHLRVKRRSTASGAERSALVVIVDDLTEQEELRSRVQLSERGFREVIEYAPDGIAIHRDEKFLYVNSAFIDKFGVDDADELLGTYVFNFVHPDEHSDLKARVRRMLATGEQVPMRETVLLRADGSEWVADLTGRMVIFDGAPAIASIARDITEKKRMAARMMQMDRMITAGTLAAGVGHEINNPLSYVTTNLEFSSRSLKDLQESLDTPGDEQRHDIDHASLRRDIDVVIEAVDDAIHGGNRIRNIVKQLHTFSPDDNNSRRSTNLRSIIDSVVDIVSHKIRDRARLIIVDDDPPQAVDGAPSRLAQVFLNLLLNAIHAIDEGNVEENEIRIELAERDQWLVVEVSDTGAGIKEAQLPRIFDPFFTTKPVDKGSGLGLYICQQIVEAHDGRIEVESEPGRGTLFRVLLPQVKSE